MLSEHLFIMITLRLRRTNSYLQTRVQCVLASFIFLILQVHIKIGQFCGCDRVRFKGKCQYTLNIKNYLFSPKSKMCLKGLYSLYSMTPIVRPFFQRKNSETKTLNQEVNRTLQRIDHTHRGVCSLTSQQLNDLYKITGSNGMWLCQRLHLHQHHPTLEGL